MTDEMKVMCNDILQHYGEEHQQEKQQQHTAQGSINSLHQWLLSQKSA